MPATATKDPLRQFSDEMRELIYLQQRKNCAVCGSGVNWADAQIHHVREHHHGGKTTLDNAALVHKACHPKSAQAVAEFAGKWEKRLARQRRCFADLMPFLHRMRRCSLSNTIANLRRHIRVALGGAMKQRFLLGLRDGRNGGTDSFGRKRLTCSIGGRFGGRLHEIGVDAEEVGEGVEVAGQRADARQRLPFFVPQAPVAHCREPDVIRQAPVTRNQFGPQWCQRAEPTGAVVPVIVFGRIAVVANVEDQILLVR